jgi:DNA-binding transcriptional LysR family regulator
MLNGADLSRMDLNLLVLFEAVLEERHVKRAADRLNLSPSAVSHGLGRLRRMLNDPLFLKHPKGVVATARAVELAEPIADVLARVRRVVASADRFDAARSVRRFSIGAPDGVSLVILSPLLRHLARTAAGIGLSVLNILPQTALADLDARRVDVAIQPIDDIPARFVSSPLYEEEFVIAMRRGHPLGGKPSLERYASASHILVSATGDARGNVDEAIEARGHKRRVVLTVGDFLSALALVGETDLVAAVPRRVAEANRTRLRLVLAPMPMRLEGSTIRIIAPRVAMMDAGVAWLFKTLRTGQGMPSWALQPRAASGIIGRQCIRSRSFTGRTTPIPSR